ncbi:MAG: glycosyltransferase [Deltaproteobacteria bacterium]|nr:glycosyltransferase [Deltaproteobacteria bacterium]
MPLVSVIVPSHNRRALLREAVESVLGQRGVAIDLIVVDDGSSDGSEGELSEFGARVRYRWQPQRGVSAARNAGARLARGRWLAFLDSDDLWLPDKLATQLAFVSEHPETTICQTGEIWIRNGVRVNPCRHHRKPDGDVFLASLQRCVVSPSAVMLRRELFEATGGFDESLPACEDYDLWLRLARHQQVALIDRPLVIKRGGHADQLSRRYWGMDRFRVQALRKLLAEPGLDQVRRAAVCAVLAEKCAILALGAAKRGRHQEAVAYAALATAPTNPAPGGGGSWLSWS